MNVRKSARWQLKSACTSTPSRLRNGPIFPLGVIGAQADVRGTCPMNPVVLIMGSLGLADFGICELRPLQKVKRRGRLPPQLFSYVSGNDR